MTSLSGRRVVVIGASAGLGRSVVMKAVACGAEVVAVARRKDKLDTVVQDAGGGTYFVTDVRSLDDCRALATYLSEGPPVDVLVSTVGAAPAAWLRNTTPEQWQDVFATNVIGPAQVIAACLPTLATNALVWVASSASVGAAQSGLGAYSASKAALEQMILTMRAEHPEIRFGVVSLGGTMPTEFGHSFDRSVVGEAIADWIGRGLVQSRQMPTDDVAEVLVGMLGASVGIPEVSFDTIVMRSPAPPARA